jgi:hypothetical protein
MKCSYCGEQIPRIGLAYGRDWPYVSQLAKDRETVAELTGLGDGWCAAVSRLVLRATEPVYVPRIGVCERCRGAGLCNLNGKPSDSFEPGQILVECRVCNGTGRVCRD